MILLSKILFHPDPPGADAFVCNSLSQLDLGLVRGFGSSLALHLDAGFCEWIGRRR
jgi:hypothetical protein